MAGLIEERRGIRGRGPGLVAAADLDRDRLVAAPGPARPLAGARMAARRGAQRATDVAHVGVPRRAPARDRSAVAIVGVAVDGEDHEAERGHVDGLAADRRLAGPAADAFAIRRAVLDEARRAGRDPAAAIVGHALVAGRPDLHDAIAAVELDRGPAPGRGGRGAARRHRGERARLVAHRPVRGVVAAELADPLRLGERLVAHVGRPTGLDAGPGPADLGRGDPRAGRVGAGAIVDPERADAPGRAGPRDRPALVIVAVAIVVRDDVVAGGAKRARWRPPGPVALAPDARHRDLDADRAARDPVAIVVGERLAIGGPGDAAAIVDRRGWACRAAHGGAAGRGAGGDGERREHAGADDHRRGYAWPRARICARSRARRFAHDVRADRQVGGCANPTATLGAVA